MTWWLNGRSPVPPKDIDAAYRELVLPCLALTFGSPGLALCSLFTDSLKSSSEAVDFLVRSVEITRSVRFEPQFGNSLKPRPLRIIGTHFSALAALVLACFADETWKIYDFLRPGVSVANADLRTAFSSSLVRNSSGIGYSEGFFRSIFVPDSSNSMAS